MKNLKGVYVVMATPFKANGEIDYEGAKKNINWYIEEGVHGLLPLGATGEYASFDFNERKEFAEFVMNEVAGRVPVVIGTITPTAEKTIELTNHAESIGASGAMILTPPGSHASQSEIYNYFKTISENVSIPIMIYNNPGSAGVDIQFDTLKEIAKLPNMDYIKESTGDIKRLTLINDLMEGEITTFCGWEDMAYESFVMGAKGWVSVLGNIAPKQCVELFELVENNEYEKAWKLYRNLLPMLRYFETSGKLWQTVKYVLDKKGYAGGVCRSPRLPLSQKDISDIENVLTLHDLN